MTLAAGVSLTAAEPADGQIKSALDDVVRLEAQFAGVASPNQATVNRTLRLLDIARGRLDGSPNKSHASWVEVDARLNALIAHLKSLGNSPEPATGPALTTPAATPTSAQRVAAPQMISQSRARIKRLVRDLASATETIDKGGPKPFQSESYVADQKRRVASFEETLAQFAGFPEDADVVGAGAALEKLRNMIALGEQLAARELAAIGDVQATLAALDAQRPDPPASPQTPYEVETVTSWIDAIAKFRPSAAAALEQLAMIRERAYLPVNTGTVQQGAPYDSQDIDRLDRAYRDSLAKVDRALQEISANLDLQASHVAGTLEFVERLDPANRSDQANAFLSAGAAARMRQQLDDARRAVAVAVWFDQRLRREQLADHTRMLARVEKTRADYDEKYTRARSLVRVPKAASTDGALRSIAAETLRNPDYAVGKIRRLVIVTEKVHREKKSSEIEVDKVDVAPGGTLKLSGTETTWTYSWDEFQVATVEPADGGFYVYYNTLKLFSSGGPKTPLNRWILSERFQSVEIPEPNIDRD